MITMAFLQSLSAQISDTLAELSCPICLSVATDAVVLSCGHLGCDEHINEWLSRKRECPTCRAEVSDTPVKSHALDGVLSKLVNMQTSVEKAHLDRALMRTSSSDQGEAGDTSAGMPKGVDQLEKLFRNHIRSALQTCSAYAVELQAERETELRAAKVQLDAVKSASTAAGVTDGPGAVEDARSVVAQAEYDAKTKAAHDKYDRLFAALVADVDSYLSEAAVPVNLLPTTIPVSVPALGVRVDVKIRPMDTIDSAIISAVAKAVAELQGLDTVVYPDEASWRWESAVGTESAALDTALSLYKQCAHGRPEAGAVLTCVGSVTATSARASKCLVDVWGAGMKEDYFWCTTCSLKWICASCAKSCHTPLGHNIVPFLTGHVPTFACCYCRTRSSKCCIKGGSTPSTGAGDR